MLQLVFTFIFLHTYFYICAACVVFIFARLLRLYNLFFVTFLGSFDPFPLYFFLSRMPPLVGLLGGGYVEAQRLRELESKMFL